MATWVFSERSLYAVARPSVRLSSVTLSVTLVHPIQAVEILFFYGIWYPGHPLTSTKNFTVIVPGTRGIAKYSDFGPIEGYISVTVQDRR